MPNITIEEIQKFGSWGIFTLLFLLSTTALWLIILRYISTTYLDTANPSQVFAIGVDILSVLINFILTIGLLYIYSQLVDVQYYQANSLENTYRAQFTPKVGIINHEGKQELPIEEDRQFAAANFLLVFLRNEGHGYAQNLQVEFKIRYDPVVDDFEIDSHTVGLQSLAQPIRYGMEEGAMINGRIQEEKFYASVLFSHIEEGNNRNPIPFAEAIDKLLESGVGEVDFGFEVAWEDAVGNSDSVSPTGRSIELSEGLSFKQVMEEGEHIEF